MQTLTSRVLKRAWIRNPDAPLGQPATGKISCPCGQTPESTFGDGQEVRCLCGIIYDSYGWIKMEVGV